MSPLRWSLWTMSSVAVVLVVLLIYMDRQLRLHSVPEPRLVQRTVQEARSPKTGARDRDRDVLLGDRDDRDVPGEDVPVPVPVPGEDVPPGDRDRDVPPRETIVGGRRMVHLSPQSPQTQGSLDLSQVFIAVKTSGRFHRTRLALLLETWISRTKTHVSHGPLY
ncbi:unnamed protein product [Merluccius merluccius]